LCGRGSRTRTIQTIATLREDRYSDGQLRSFLFADLLIAGSEHARSKLTSLGFCNVRRIYPGIDVEHFSPAPKDARLLAGFGLSHADFVVSYPGEYSRLGATDDIVELIVRHARSWREARIRFVFACRVKNGADRKKKRQVTERLGQAGGLDRVVFTDTVADMAGLYNLSDAIIFPVRDMHGKFDIPLAAIEPMACEKPVIVSDVPILDEFAREGASVRVRRGDVEQLRAAILDLFHDRAKGRRLGEKARQFVEANFDIHLAARAYGQIYDEL
jgi:glycosyltransferase involved in cell wall biosynthesis